MSDINNLTFFRIVEKQVREAMQQAETKMLPVARQAHFDTELSNQQHPIEGYYSKSPELTEYFNLIRTLQLNFSDKITDSIRQLHDFYSNDVFGLGQAVRTTINSENIWYPNAPPAVISPRVDPLTVAVSKALKSSATAHQDLTVENIAEILEDVEIGKGLVGLGSLVDKIERQKTYIYNPVATTLARETTVLSAYVPTARGLSSYNVSPEVEAQGNAVIEAYNSLFKAFGINVRIEHITRDNAFRLNQDLPSMDRCVRIFNLELPGREKEFYHWAVGMENYKPKVIDFWRNQIVTTDMFKKAPEQYQSQ